MTPTFLRRGEKTFPYHGFGVELKPEKWRTLLFLHGCLPAWKHCSIVVMFCRNVQVSFQRLILHREGSFPSVGILFQHFLSFDTEHYHADTQFDWYEFPFRKHIATHSWNDTFLFALWMLLMTATRSGTNCNNTFKKSLYFLRNHGYQILFNHWWTHNPKHLCTLGLRTWFPCAPGRWRVQPTYLLVHLL